MRALSMGLVLSTLTFAACDQGPRDQGLSGEVATSDLTASADAAPNTTAPAKSVHQSTTVRHTGGTATTRAPSAPAREPVVVVHRHTKRDAAIGAGVGAVVGGATHGTKGAIVGGVLGGAAGAIVGHKVDKHTEVVR